MEAISGFLCYLMVGMTGLKHIFEKPPIASPSLEIHGIGICEEMPPTLVHRPAGTGDYLFMCFHQPCYGGDAAGRRLRPRNAFVVWTPGFPHWYGGTDGAWTHSWLHCAGRKVPRWLRESGLASNTVLAPADLAAFERGLELLHRELTGGYPPDGKIVANLLENALRETGRSLRPAEAARVPAWLLETRAYLDTHFADPLRLADVARRFHRSVPQLCARFKEHFHIPVMEYVIRLRMRRAAYLLRDFNTGIAQVAEQCGYTDPYHFSKLFKQRHGLSPRAYRNRPQE